MKKIILVVLITAFLMSCKKSSQCYHCTFGVGPNGTIPPPETYCGPDGASHIFVDSFGNRLSSTCTPQ